MQINSVFMLGWFIWFIHGVNLAGGVLTGEHNTAGKVQPLTEFVNFKGVVLDEHTKQPVAYALVVLEQSKTTVQANSSGEFILPIPVKLMAGSLKVTSLGYTSRSVTIATLLKEKGNAAQVKIYLKPKYEGLGEVEIKARSRKWKTKKVGFNIDKGTYFHHQFSPLDTLVAKSGQEIGNGFQLKKYPAYLQSISFGLAGSGNVKSVVGINLYSLKNNLPDKTILPKRVVVRIPPHHTGWITIDLLKQNIILQEDFAVTVEWLNDTNSLTPSSLMAFASQPDDQVTYYRVSGQEPWKILKPTLTNVNSIGMYVSIKY